MKTKQEIEDFIYDHYKTKYREGFLPTEMDYVIKEVAKHHDLKMDRFDDAMKGNTCMIREGKLITYHCDLYKALICAIEDRSLSVGEWY